MGWLFIGYVVWFVFLVFCLGVFCFCVGCCVYVCVCVFDGGGVEVGSCFGWVRLVKQLSAGTATTATATATDPMRLRATELERPLCTSRTEEKSYVPMYSRR